MKNITVILGIAGNQNFDTSGILYEVRTRIFFKKAVDFPPAWTGGRSKEPRPRRPLSLQRKWLQVEPAAPPEENWRNADALITPKSRNRGKTPQGEVLTACSCRQACRQHGTGYNI